jgi:hypothetical protein
VPCLQHELHLLDPLRALLDVRLLDEPLARRVRTAPSPRECGRPRHCGDAALADDTRRTTCERTAGDAVTNQRHWTGAPKEMSPGVRSSRHWSGIAYLSKSDGRTCAHSEHSKYVLTYSMVPAHVGRPHAVAQRTHSTTNNGTTGAEGAKVLRAGMAQGSHGTGQSWHREARTPSHLMSGVAKLPESCDIASDP